MLSDKAVLNLARMIKDYCLLRRECAGCPFNNGENNHYCMFVNGDGPYKWGIQNKKGKSMKSISAQLEEVKNKMCDQYCKYPEKPVPEGKTEDWLWLDEESPCNNCPLNQL